jgi:subfamily B ATP-binding cassette protein MsbA
MFRIRAGRHQIPRPINGRIRDVKEGSALWQSIELIGHLKLEYFGLICSSAIVAGVEGVLHPLLIKAIFDQGVHQNNFHRFSILTLAYLCFGVLINLIGTAVSLWSKSFENRTVKQVSHKLLSAYYRTEYIEVLRKGQGYFVNRIYGDLREGLVPLLGLIQTSISQAVLLIASSLVLLYLSWRAFLILTVLIPVSASAGVILRGKIRELTNQEREQDGAVLSFLVKAISAFRTIKEFEFFDATSKTMDAKLGFYFTANFQRYRVLRLFQAVNDTTMVISDSLSLFVGALFVLRGALTFGAYLAFINTFWRTVTTLVQLISRIAEFHGLIAIADRLQSFLAASAAIYYQIGAAPSVANLAFAFEGRQVLSELSFESSLGEKILLVGPNGSGKTTLANILSGYLAPSSGTVVLPARISSTTLPIVFPPLKVSELGADATLLLRLGLMSSAVLNSPADELSAGQQQKLAIAFALTRDADLYIIDEPLACLDQESRHVAMQAIFERTRSKTLIVIMHAVTSEHLVLFDRVVTLQPVMEVDGACMTASQ